jgi:hypothetical protein
MKLISFIFLFAVGQLSMAAQVAIVLSNKAVIFADINLKSPIGYVKKGKKLAVGDVKRKRGKVLPVLVNQQIGWVRVSDVRLPSEEKSFDRSKKVSEHVIDFEKKTKDPLDQNNFLTVKLSPASFSIAGTASEVEFSESLTSGTELTLMYEHKNPYHKVHWGIGLDYFSGNIDVFSFQSINLKGGFAYVPIRLSWVSLEVYGNLLLSGDFRVDSEALGTYKGNMYGLDYGVAARLLPEYKIGLVAGLGYSYYRFNGLNDIQRDSDDSLTNFTTISGAKLFAGLSYRF